MTTLESQPEVRTQEKVKGVGSFQTLWQAGPPSWHNWDSADELISSMVAGGRGMPIVRLFDYFTGRSVGFTGAVKLYEHEFVRVYAQNPARREPYLSRFGDFDAIYVQYSGTSTVETEYGPYEMTPFHALVVPAGVAHRTIGDKDTRRLAIFSKVPVRPVSSDLATCDRTFVVQSQGDVDWEGAPSFVDPSLESEGKELEATWLWDAPLYSPLWIKRRKGALEGGTTGGREPTLLGVFNFIGGMATEKSGAIGPFIFENANMQMRSYNIEGQQFGFHRGNGSDELWMQFRSSSINDTEFGKIPLSIGESTIAFPGNAHRIFGETGFLRLNLYSERPLRLCVDPYQAVTHTAFTVIETTKD